MSSDPKGTLFVTGVMLGIPWLIWTIQNAFRKSAGLPPAEVGGPMVLGEQELGREDSDTSV